MNETVDPDSPIGRTARAWALAVFDDDFPPSKADRLGAWLAEDPRHLAAYEHAEATLATLSRMDGLRALPRPAPKPAPRPRLVAPLLAAATALAACVVGAVFLALPSPAIESGVGQVRQVVLRDGSQVTLGPASRLRVTSRLDDRSLSLDRGEAFFVVARQDGRPFTVAAAGATVRVVGTRFDVRRGADGLVRVQVEQGVVKVAGRVRPGAEAVLTAGQQALLGDAPTRISDLDTASEAGAWRAGRLSYVDAPLAEVVEDLNRYRQRPIRVASPAVGALKLTAAFEARQADSFLASLPTALPVRLVQDRQGQTVLVGARDGMRP